MSAHGGNRLLANDESRSRLIGFEATFGLYRGMFEFGLILRLGNASQVVWSWPFVLPGWVALFFVTVNQVLVRLWARVTQGLSSGRLRVPSFDRLV